MCSLFWPSFHCVSFLLQLRDTVDKCSVDIMWTSVPHNTIHIEHSKFVTVLYDDIARKQAA